MNVRNFWDKKLRLDDYFFSWVNKALLFRYWLKADKSILIKNKQQKGKHKGGKAYIILNGPSIKNQDLSCLEGEQIFFVNRAFQHPLYAVLKPSYHVFIDPKMATGEWPVTFLDEVLTLNPDVTFVLDYRWFHLPQFQPYIGKCKIIWICCELFFTPFFDEDIDLTKPMPGTAVFGAALATAIYLGFTEINFTGFDGNGLCYEMINQSSHFYGVNEENLKKTSKDYIKDLYMMSLNLKNLWNTAEYARRKGIKIYNMTDGGLLDMFERKRFGQSTLTTPQL